MHKLYGPFLVFLAILIPVLWVVNCSGPRPVVSRLRLQSPRSPGGPYQVQALVHNDSPGHGQVAITFRLLNTATGHTIEQDQKVTLQSGETSLVSARITAPPATYTPEVDASYPPG